MVAAAESVTVGRIQAMVGRASGASNVFAGGMTAYNIDQKVRLLGVSRAHAQEVDCVSGMVAGQMAAGVAAAFQADIGIATTGYAEPVDPNSNETFAYFAIYDKQESEHNGGIVRGDRLSGTGLSRTQSQERFATQAFDELLRYVEQRSASSADHDRAPARLRIERVASDTYRLGDKTVSSIGSLEASVTAVKKPIEVHAVKIEEPFDVVTSEGLMNGKPGDWLIQGVAGEVYVCPDDIFLRSYDF
jgi:nicotinamide-nucleotide amidase